MAEVKGISDKKHTAGVLGQNTNTTNEAGVGVHGKSKAAGVLGESETWHGVAGLSQSTTGGFGVYGKSIGTGVGGESETWMGVYGESHSTTGGFGVYGKAIGAGVVGESETWMGVYGHSKSTVGGAGVMGEGVSGPGVIGKSGQWIGVYGETSGVENGPAGVWGEHKGAGVGVKAISKDGTGLEAYNLNPNGPGYAIFAKKEGNQGHAGFFVGNVHVTGNITTDGDVILRNADCAEDFDIADDILVEPGTVMVLNEEGALMQSQQAYDKRVAGVISGAGDFKPGIVLDKRESQNVRQPVALLGKVFCKADTRNGAIEVGDLLTTSDIPGFAMKVTDPFKAFGAVIGKALRPLQEGQGLIPILIALQ
jgi:hypothetical protein